MSALQVGSRVEVWERRGQSERLCYVGVITAEWPRCQAWDHDLRRRA